MVTDIENWEKPIKEIGVAGLVSAVAFLWITHDIRPLEELWTEIYPEDPMTKEEAAEIMFGGVTEIHHLILQSDDDLNLVIEGLRREGLGELSDLVERELQQSRP